jgi:uncharacterized membrane protein YczE
MKRAPRIRGGRVVRSVSLVLGLAVVAAGIVSLLESDLGLAPWDVFHLGVANHSPLTLGEASIVVGLVVLVFGWLLGATPGVGTIANALLIGLFVDLFAGIRWVGELPDEGAIVHATLLVLGVALFGLGSALYIGAGMGAGPRDGLMLAVSRRSGRRIALVRGLIEITALIAGIVLGGTVGLGTVAVALLVGPSVEVSFWLLEHLGLADETELISIPAPLPPAS